MGEALAEAMTNAEAAQRLVNAVLSDRPVESHTHPFYLYPARLSPSVVESAIELFTSPGDLVMDPFVGGGTTLVEAAALARPSLGSDINELAVFVSKAKTHLYTRSELAAVETWCEKLPPRTNLRLGRARTNTKGDNDPFLNAGTRETWRVTKLLELAAESIAELDSVPAQRLARCVLLRTGRWALDCRLNVPAVGDVRRRVREFTLEMTARARDYAALVRGNARATGQKPSKIIPKCIVADVSAVRESRVVRRVPAPRLVLCSPPYPGTHVLYHRWQVRGRRETPALYWIAGCKDSHGPAYYGMGGRTKKGIDDYFGRVRGAFESLANVLDCESVVVQVISFSKPEEHLRRYLEAMLDAGFEEELLPSPSISTPDRRLWRDVPNRRWYTYRPGVVQSKREVVLFHKLASSA